MTLGGVAFWIEADTVIAPTVTKEVAQPSDAFVGMHLDTASMSLYCRVGAREKLRELAREAPTVQAPPEPPAPPALDPARDPARDLNTAPLF